MNKLCFCVCLLVIHPSLHAGLALDSTSGSNNAAGGHSTVGWSFSVLSSLDVDGLGFFDFESNGLLAPHQVGLWDSGGTLLASATVTSGSTVVASTST